MTPAPQGRTPDKAKVIAGAGGVVVNGEGDVLLIRHRNGTWVFPKGHVDAGETSLEAAIREVAEEAGVATRCPDPNQVFITSYVNVRGEPRRITWFLLRTDASTPVMGEEIFPEGEFVAPAEALERLSFEEDRRLLREMMASPVWRGAH